MECGSSYNSRFTGNLNSYGNTPKTCVSGFNQLIGLEKDKKGIINVNMKCRYSTYGSNSNSENSYGAGVAWNGALTCPEGKVMNGLLVFEKNGGGIINFKAICTKGLGRLLM